MKQDLLDMTLSKKKKKTLESKLLKDYPQIVK